MKGMTAGREALKQFTDRLEEQLLTQGYPGQEDIWRALEYITEEADSGLYGKACYYAAYDAFLNGRQEDALNFLTEGIRCMEGTTEEGDIARCYNILGIIAHGQSNLILAMEQYDMALNYARRHGSKLINSIVVSNMADAYYRMGAYKRAIRCYRECIAEYEASGHDSVSGEYNYQMMLAGYGYCLVKAGYLEEAEETAAKLWSMIFEPKREAVPKLATYTFFAALSFRQGEMEKAEHCMETAIRNVREKVCAVTEFDNLLDLLDCLAQAGETERLREVLDCVEPRLDGELHEGLWMQLLLYRLKYCSEAMGQEEFIQCSRLFFELKERYECDENNQVLRMMELRKRLRHIRRERELLKEQNTELRYKAEHDQITGLPNRGYLNRYLEVTFHEAERRKERLGILFVDIDYFKQLNDRYGHQKGDECIAAVAEAVREGAGEEFAARYGGDEFVVVMKNPSDREVRECAGRISDYVSGRRIPNADSGPEGIVSVTMGGVCAVPQRYHKVWDFMTAADEALYEQKKEGKGGLRYYNRLGAED